MPGIVWSAPLLRSNHYNTQVSIQTDHDLHKGISSLLESTRCQERWQHHLFKFDFEIVHEAGVEHQVEGALSRLTTTDAVISAPKNGFSRLMIDKLVVWLVPGILFVDTNECGKREELMLSDDTPAPTAHNDNSVSRDIQRLSKDQSSDTFCQAMICSEPTPDFIGSMDQHPLLSRCFSIDG